MNIVDLLIAMGIAFGVKSNAIYDEENNIRIWWIESRPFPVRFCEIIFKIWYWMGILIPETIIWLVLSYFDIWYWIKKGIDS